MEKTIISKNENQSKNLFKFLIPSLFGLLLFVIPLPYGKLFKLDGLSPINIGIGFLAELIKIIAADYLINIALVVILASAILSVVSKFINIKNEFINNLLNVSPLWLTFRILGALSWLGDGTLGIMITDTQYKQGFYTAKEACIISVCFSLVSLPFSTVIADQLGFMPMFVPFYLTVCLASLACALIMPRIYPLNKFNDSTYTNVNHLKEELVPSGTNLFSFGLNKAINRASTAPSFKEIMINGFKTVIDMYLALLPLVMAWGTLALIVAEFTPFFKIISIPVVFILKLLGIPDATAAAPAVLVGFTDMFLPSIMVSGNDISQVTQFIIGTLSITQLIYLTETGAVILKSDIPLKLKDLFVLFIVRTLISLPVITIIAKLIFSL